MSNQRWVYVAFRHYSDRSYPGCGPVCGRSEPALRFPGFGSSVSGFSVSGCPGSGKDLGQPPSRQGWGTVAVTAGHVLVGDQRVGDGLFGGLDDGPVERNAKGFSCLTGCGSSCFWLLRAAPLPAGMSGRRRVAPGTAGSTVRQGSSFRLVLGACGGVGHGDDGGAVPVTVSVPLACGTVDGDFDVRARCRPRSTTLR